jgi:hypothetical protein
LNKHGDSVNPTSFRLDYWDRILGALKIHKQKFHATRNTFMTEMFRKNINLKDIAD